MIAWRDYNVEVNYIASKYTLLIRACPDTVVLIKPVGGKPVDWTAQ